MSAAPGVSARVASALSREIPPTQNEHDLVSQAAEGAIDSAAATMEAYTLSAAEESPLVERQIAPSNGGLEQAIINLYGRVLRNPGPSIEMLPLLFPNDYSYGLITVFGSRDMFRLVRPSERVAPSVVVEAPPNVMLPSEDRTQNIYLVEDTVSVFSDRIQICNGGTPQDRLINSLIQLRTPIAAPPDLATEYQQMYEELIKDKRRTQNCVTQLLSPLSPEVRRVFEDSFSIMLELQTPIYPAAITLMHELVLARHKVLDIFESLLVNASFCEDWSKACQTINQWCQSRQGQAALQFLHQDLKSLFQQYHKLLNTFPCPISKNIQLFLVRVLDYIEKKPDLPVDLTLLYIACLRQQLRSYYIPHPMSQEVQRFLDDVMEFAKKSKKLSMDDIPQESIVQLIALLQPVINVWPSYLQAINKLVDVAQPNKQPTAYLQAIEQLCKAAIAEKQKASLASEGADVLGSLSDETAQVMH